MVASLGPGSPGLCVFLLGTWLTPQVGRVGLGQKGVHSALTS